MIDAVVKAAIEEAIRFLRPGDVYRATVDEHEITIVPTTEDDPGNKTRVLRRYIVVCRTCSKFLSDNTRRPYTAIHFHANEIIE